MAVRGLPPIGQAMNKEPRNASVGSTDGYLLDLMRSSNIMAVSLLEQKGCYRDLMRLSALVLHEQVGDA